MVVYRLATVFVFKQKTAYEMRISDWSSDVCSSDLRPGTAEGGAHGCGPALHLTRIPDPLPPERTHPRPPVLWLAKTANPQGRHCSRRHEPEAGEKIARIGCRRMGGDRCADLNGDRKSTRLNSSH